ncbi:hypothetical protein ACFUYE_05370 [Micromonospora humida]|uniref:hypothetical protein n=1 Tax=Micromonospora humida TaxID=2809018 RepID=UPI00366B00FA
MDSDWVWMRNPETDGVQKFAADAVDAWREMGWEPCDPPADQNLALDPNHPALAGSPDAGTAGYAAGMRTAAALAGEIDSGDSAKPVKKQSTGRAPATDKEE